MKNAQEEEPKREGEPTKEEESSSEIEKIEQNLSSQKTTINPKASLTLEQAIEFGEYDPEFLANFPEWHQLTPHIQWQLVRKALDIKKKQLWTQYNELVSVLDFRLKSNVHNSIKNIEKQLADLSKDRERLYVEFTDKF